MPRDRLGWGLAMAAPLLLASTIARAETSWVNWSGAVAADIGGSATGTVLGVDVSYEGELDSFVVDGSSTIWSPDSSFVGGTSTVSPSVVGDELRLDGSGAIFPFNTRTITFSTAVINPVVAIWSLGSSTSASVITMNCGGLAALQAGGPSSAFGGSSIAVLSANAIRGLEGNGVVGCNSTVTSITFISTSGDEFAIAVGVNGVMTPVPELPTLVLMALGLVGLVRRQRAAAACERATA